MRSGIVTAVSGLAVALAPDVAHYLPFFRPIVTGHQLGGGVASSLAAAVAAILFISLAFLILHRKHILCCAALSFADCCLNFNLELTPLSRTVSVSGSQLLQFKTMFYVLLGVAGIWLFATGAILFSINALSIGLDETSAVANGAIYMSAFALVLVLNVAIIFPGLLLLQPIRLLKVMRAERVAVTPRQRFRGVFVPYLSTTIH